MSWIVYQNMRQQLQRQLAGRLQPVPRRQRGDPRAPPGRCDDRPRAARLRPGRPLSRSRSTRASPTPCPARLRQRPVAFLETFRQDISERQAAAGVLDHRASGTYSEHPGPSSPVQGAWYIQEVLDALTAVPEVWSKTVLLVNFDENDGFFDHVPSPSAPSPQRRRHARRQDHAARCRRGLRALHASAPAGPRASRAGRPRLRPRPARADVRDLAVEPRRLGQLAGLRPHLGDPLPREALRREGAATSARSAAPSAAT